MKKFWKIAGIATLVAVIGIAALGIAVYAQEPEPINTMADYLERVLDAIASKLGVERATLDTAMDEAQREVIEQAVEEGLLSQEQADRALDRLDEGTVFAMPFAPGRRGHPGLWGGRMGGSLPQWQDLAEQLGMTLDELAAELQAGKTIAELAEEKGVDLQAAQIEAMKEQIQQAVEDGKISQEQADWLLEGLEQGFMPGPRGFGFGGRRGGCLGGFGGFWGQSGPNSQNNQSNL